MATKNHELAIFTEDDFANVTKAGYGWNTRLQHKSEHVCRPDYDRRIVYSTSSAEARLREDQHGYCELCVFVWSIADKKGIRVLKTTMPKLETAAQRRKYLKQVAAYTEKLNKKMKELDKLTSEMDDKTYHI